MGEKEIETDKVREKARPKNRSVTKETFFRDKRN